MQVCCGPIEVI